MDKLKEKLHIGKSKEERANDLAGHGGEQGDIQEGRHSHDSELEAMTPDERVKYLKEFDYAEKHGEPKKGSYLDKLIARGNKKTEDDLREEAELAEKARARQASEGLIR